MDKDSTSDWVALYGPAGCGKDSIADHLVADYGFTRIAFADPVRDMALAINPWIPSWDVLERAEDGQPKKVYYNVRLSSIVNSYGWEYAKREYCEVRRLLQQIGTDAVRVHTPDYLVDLARAKAIESGTPVVFTDTRFPNEADMVRDVGGLVVHIAAPVRVNTMAASHASETSMAAYRPDGTLINEHSDNQSEVDRRMKRFARIIASALANPVDSTGTSLSFLS